MINQKKGVSLLCAADFEWLNVCYGDFSKYETAKVPVYTLWNGTKAWTCQEVAFFHTSIIESRKLGQQAESRVFDKFIESEKINLVRLIAADPSNIVRSCFILREGVEVVEFPMEDYSKPIKYLVLKYVYNKEKEAEEWIQAMETTD